MTGRRVAAAAALTVALGSASAFAGMNGPVPVPTSGATPVKVAVKVRTSSYPVYDARGRRIGAATWRGPPAGRNRPRPHVQPTRTRPAIDSRPPPPRDTTARGGRRNPA